MPNSETGLPAILAYMREERGPDNGADLKDEDLEGLANDLWDWVKDLPEGKRSVRLRDLGKTATLLEVAGPDAPFLVDSILGQCLDSTVEARVIFHPIIARDKDAVSRGERWSVIQVHLPLLSSREQDHLLKGVEKTLDDLGAVITDFVEMLSRMREERTRLSNVMSLEEYDRAEALAFLDWLVADHFVFLGARTYRFEIDDDGKFVREEPVMVEGSNLGVLRDEVLNVLSRGAEPTMLTGAVGEFLQGPEPLIIAKSTLVSRIHRRVRADYVGVKHYDDRGRVIGETRFLGLFTAEAYDETARSVPLIRRRVERVLKTTSARAGGHKAKTLANILETWPRDELFQTDAETLASMAQGVLHLMGRPRTRLFLRHDQFDRFVSAIIYVPRDAYDSDLRQKLVNMLVEAYDAKLLRFQPRFDAGTMVRLHIQLSLEPGHPAPKLEDLQDKAVAIATRWEDSFRDALISAPMEDKVREGAMQFRDAFNVAYREAFPPEEAMLDVAEIAALNSTCPVRMRAYRKEIDKKDVIRAKVYSRGKPIPLSQSVPVFENMGLFVEFETGYRVTPADKPTEDAPEHYWVHNLLMRHENASPIDLEAVSGDFQNTFAAVWLNEVENDAFNRLIFDAGATWQQANLLRGLSAYRRQTGLDPTMSSQVRAFAAHKDVTANILKMFDALFDPAGEGDLASREAEAQDLLSSIKQQLTSVPSLEDDRVLRRTANLVNAIQRTNFYCKGEEPLAFKIATAELDVVPQPVPFREIFVAGPVVEGVHLRFGSVARGGLRWSDRPDDFRTEVLGLVKAQQVKNAVIVPVGSKGGFFPKQLPVGGRREAVREEGIKAYKIFISSLLALTDNLIDGDVHHPEDIVVRDGADPYLVVAADKGTATFSDIANEISVGQGFWLGDAFASGGSAGYDHKAMGITARGAWEAVKRHFLETGKDIQQDPFTVIGVGDMSGDVFGNGMLLSKQIRLVAAFNHMHVFVDPNPGDPETMWNERKRLFDLPRSGWAEYDTSLISEGGGVFERSAKSVPLSDEIKSLTGLTGDEVTPDELIHALLKADVELLWFGGIGTYVRSSQENDRDVGDRANDGIRIESERLKAKVVGEGANLGLTQAARIEFAAAGGRINTDAIDNSAGVDSSDHEVNIKILLSEAIRRGDLPSGDRNTLLASMTDDVAAHVLAHNIAQTGALTLAESTVHEDHDELERVMVWLEERGVLNREVEGLPSSEVMLSRGAKGQPLTRPELSVLLAWAKIVVFDDIVASDLPDDPYFKPVLENYFPEALRQFSDVMDAHRLKREIIATILANRLLDTAGPVFLLRMMEVTGAETAACVRAFEVARAALDMPTLTEEINDPKQVAQAEARTMLHLSVAEQVSEVAGHLLRTDAKDEIPALIAGYHDAFEALGKGYSEACDKL